MTFQEDVEASEATDAGRPRRKRAVSAGGLQQLSTQLGFFKASAQSVLNFRKRVEQGLERELEFHISLRAACNLSIKTTPSDGKSLKRSLGNAEECDATAILQCSREKPHHISACQGTHLQAAASMWLCGVNLCKIQGLSGHSCITTAS